VLTEVEVESSNQEVESCVASEPQPQDININDSHDISSVAAIGSESESDVEQVETEQYSVGQFVKVKYSRSVYVAQVVKAKVDRNVYFVNCMHKRKQHYFWPKYKDQMWVNSDAIVGVHEFEN
jgi:hypothetical protein